MRLSLLILALALSTTAQAATISLGPSDDVSWHIANQSPQGGALSGSDSVLWVKGYDQFVNSTGVEPTYSWLSFSQGSFDSLNGTLTGATLQLTTTHSTALSQGIEVYLVTNASGLSESTNWSGVFGGSSNFRTFTDITNPSPIDVQNSGGVGAVLSFDVTSAVQAWRDDPSANQGLLIAAPGAQTAYFGFSSGEGGAPPLLSVTTVPEPSLLGLLAVGMLGCASGLRRRT